MVYEIFVICQKNFKMKIFCPWWRRHCPELPACLKAAADCECNCYFFVRPLTVCPRQPSCFESSRNTWLRCSDRVGSRSLVCCSRQSPRFERRICRYWSYQEVGLDWPQRFLECYLVLPFQSSFKWWKMMKCFSKHKLSDNVWVVLIFRL